MMKWPMWVRVVIGIVAILLSLALNFLLQPFLGEYSQFLLFPGMTVFVYLNPELIRGD